MTVMFVGGARRKARLYIQLAEDFDGEVYIDTVEVYDGHQVSSQTGFCAS